jgi:hypothetical protein
MAKKDAAPFILSAFDISDRINLYLIAHDAHHRGQITMLARQVGHPIPQKATFGMWEWGVR